MWASNWDSSSGCFASQDQKKVQLYSISENYTTNSSIILQNSILEYYKIVLILSVVCYSLFKDEVLEFIISNAS